MSMVPCAIIFLLGLKRIFVTALVYGSIGFMVKSADSIRFINNKKTLLLVGSVSSSIQGLTVRPTESIPV